MAAGENWTFRDWLRDLEHEVALAGERGQPVRLHVDRVPPPYALRLMAALGVPVVVVDGGRVPLLYPGPAAGGGSLLTTVHSLATADCRVAGCANQAKSSRGTYAYLCDEHIAVKRRSLGLGDGTQPQRKPDRPAASDGLEAKVKELTKLGRTADHARARAAAATQKALALKREADEAEAAFRARTRELMGESS